MLLHEGPSYPYHFLLTKILCVFHVSLVAHHITFDVAVIAVKVYKRRRGIAPLISNRGARWR
jgi:hypothetical protein